MQTGRGSQPGWWAGTSTAAQRTAAVHVRDGEYRICNQSLYMYMYIHMYAHAHVYACTCT